MSTTGLSDRFTILADDRTLAETTVALEEHGFGVDVVDSLDTARETVLARIPHGGTVMTNTSVTLQESGIADAINQSGDYDSSRNRMLALDLATQLQEMKAIAGQADYALGSVHAVTHAGVLVIASASGSQLAAYAWVHSVAAAGCGRPSHCERRKGNCRATRMGSGRRHAGSSKTSATARPSSSVD